MNRLSREKQVAVISALVEGSSIRSTERMTGVHRDTIMRLLVRTGEHCHHVLDDQMRDFHSRLIQVDEIWTFVGKKQHHLNKRERRSSELGDQYVFVALDADTKLVPTFSLGRRDLETATDFMRVLKDRLANNGRIQLTSDAFPAYPEAIERAFGADVDYAQLVKVYATEDSGSGRYAPPHVTGAVSRIITGHPNRKDISTSYIERQNLTMRMAIRRFTRLTNAFSKKLANLRAALDLHFAYYNFVRRHISLRMTPAMKAGIAPHFWSLADLIPENFSNAN